MHEGALYPRWKAVGLPSVVYNPSGIVRTLGSERSEKQNKFGNIGLAFGKGRRVLLRVVR